MVRKRVTPRPELLFGSYADVDLFNLNNQTSREHYSALGFRIEKQVSNDAAYHLQFNIYADGQLLGYVLADRTKKYGYNLDLLPLHVDNKALYTLKISRLLPQFLEAFNLEKANDTQLDIALDTQQVSAWELIKSYTSKPDQYQRVKHKNDRGFDCQGKIDEVTGEYNVTVTFGGSAAGLKMYNKSNELRQKPKPYLSAFHAANCMAPQKDVYRSELTIKAKALKSYRQSVINEDGEVLTPYQFEKTSDFYNNDSSKGRKQTHVTTQQIDIERLDDPAYLAALYTHFYPVQIRKTDRAKLSKCTPVHLFDFTTYQKEDLTMTVLVKDTENKRTNERRRIKENVLDFARTRQPLYLDVALDIATRFELQEELRHHVEQYKVAELIEHEGLYSQLERVALQTKMRLAV